MTKTTESVELDKEELEEFNRNRMKWFRQRFEAQNHRRNIIRKKRKQQRQNRRRAR